MSQYSAYESVSDYAIAKFRESLEQTENEYNFSEDLKFPHWREITQKVYNVWTKNYSDKLKIYQDENQVENLFNTFRSNMFKIMSKRSDFHTYRMYIEHVIDYYLNEIKVHSFDNKLEHKENIGNHQSNPLLNPVVRLDPLGKTFKPDINKKKRDLLNKIFLYEIDCLIRAHSKESNINDNTTPVTDAAFELDGENIELKNSEDYVPKHTNLCATCGHNIINFIDTDNGKIVKRFNDDLLMNRSKESFNCLAWTIINNLSILAAAGSHGQIKIIVPKYSSCFARIDAHTMPITCLLVHSKHSNIILSASDDKTIKIWRLTIKEGANDLESECSSELLNTIQIESSKSKSNKETIFSMCFGANDYLIISTRNNIYAIQLSDKLVFNQEQTQNMDIQDEKLSNEDAIEYMTSQAKKNENLVAHKVKMIGISSQSIVYDELIIANKLLFYKNFLFANLLNSNLIYIIEILNEEENGSQKLVLKVVGNLKGGEEKTTEVNKISLIKDDTVVYLIKSSCDGGFYIISLDESLQKFSTIQRYTIPTDYTIRPFSDPGKKTNIKNYGLLEKASVINAISNGRTVVSTTNQNIIVSWKKSKVIGY